MGDEEAGHPKSEDDPRIADRREVDGEVIAGEFVLTDPGTVEAYWEAVDEKAEELTRGAQNEMSGKVVTDSDSKGKAEKWADSLKYQLVYPLVAEEAGSGSEPEAKSYSVSASEVLKALPDAVLIELYQQDLAEKDPDKKPSRQLFTDDVPALLRSLDRMQESRLERLAEKVGVPVLELHVSNEDEAIVVLAAILLRNSAESLYGSEAAEVIEHPTIRPSVTNE